MFSCARHAKTLNTNVVTLNPRYLKPYEKVRGLGFLLVFQNDLGDFSCLMVPEQTHQNATHSRIVRWASGMLQPCHAVRRSLAIERTSASGAFSSSGGVTLPQEPMGRMPPDWRRRAKLGDDDIEMRS